MQKQGRGGGRRERKKLEVRLGLNAAGSPHFSKHSPQAARGSLTHAAKLNGEGLTPRNQYQPNIRPGCGVRVYARLTP